MSRLIDRLSEFFAHRKGLLPLVGIALVALNLLLQFILPADSIFVRANLCLHLGVVIAVFGVLLAWAL